ncbi:translation initiation factor eIF2B subunit delta-like [Tubulanus polymorphus]|uniref:translation initiation factor eIF2B subunit delta-like n=1 Tax=Tubulanus polymorphus TaxID=672921 RepID=UPI003DA65CE5
MSNSNQHDHNVVASVKTDASSPPQLQQKNQKTPGAQQQQQNATSGKKQQAKNKKQPKNTQSDQNLNASTKKLSTDGGKTIAPADGSSQGEGQTADTPQKSKAQMKAERRALQEAQRAAKQAKKDGPPAGTPKQQKSEKRVPDLMRADDVDSQKRLAKKLQRQDIPLRQTTQKKVGLFSHLHQYDKAHKITQGLSFASGGIHPAFLKLGVQYAEGVICGSNARCIALLGAIKQYIADYSTPPQKELARDLEAKLKPNISFINQCRPLSVSMGTAIKYIKWHITHTPANMSDTEAKRRLYECLNNFLQEKILLAGEAISKSCIEKIEDGDVILVYGCSSVIKKVLCDASNSGKKFRVIVVDGRPKFEGKEQLRRLVKHGINCSYVLINAASYVMQEATKVFLGAHALLANGYVMSRVGTSQISLVAKSYNVPVIVCCETYKFCERVQTDSFVSNELGDPNDLVDTQRKTNSLSHWKDDANLHLLNLAYDVTPPEFVTMVVTEKGMIPCTSVPVVLRVRQAETLG